MTKQIVFHIGLEKTGTTSFQQYCSEHRDALLENGILYPKDNLGFTADLGWPEQVIFREFYPRGLTAVDDIDDITLGTRPTMSHVTARLEMESLLRARSVERRQRSRRDGRHSCDAA